MVWVTGDKVNGFNSDAQAIYKTNCYNTLAWVKRWEGYCKKYLPAYYAYDKFPNWNELRYKADPSYRRGYPMTKLQRKIQNDIAYLCEIETMGLLRISDDKYRDYVKNGPKNHFYITAEFDMLRDEGIVLHGRLKDLADEIDNGPKVEIYDCKGAPHGFINEAVIVGGTIPEWDFFVEQYLQGVERFLNQ